MAKKILTNNVKRFIVMSLATHQSPSEVATSVKEKFGVEITRQGIQSYDPEKNAGRYLSDELKKLFVETREFYESREKQVFVNGS